MKIKCSAASLRNPADSANQTIANVEVLDCDGSECGFPAPVLFEDDDHRELDVVPHYHMIVRGSSPDAGPLIYPVLATFFGVGEP